MQTFDSPLRYTFPSKSRPDITHLVDLEEDCCTCEDHQIRKRRCRHILAARDALADQAIAGLVKIRNTPTEPDTHANSNHS